MKLKISIDDKQYEADIEVIEEERAEAAAARVPRPSAAAKAPSASPLNHDAPAAPSSGNDVKSVIVGIVVKVLVSEGQSVKKGETLLVLEAMKMESNVAAPADATVRKVLVAQGDSVKKGQVLLEFA